MNRILRFPIARPDPERVAADSLRMYYVDLVRRAYLEGAVLWGIIGAVAGTILTIAILAVVR